jgi:hypothetical protein
MTTFVVILNNNDPKTVIVLPPYKRRFVSAGGPNHAQFKTPDTNQEEKIEVRLTSAYRSSSLLSSRLVREGRLPRFTS